MVEYKIKLLADSLGVDELCQQNDVSLEYLVKLLIDEGHIDLEDYFGEGTEEDEH